MAFPFPEYCISKSTGLVHNFAFGSNLSLEKMASRGLRSVTNPRPAILQNFKLFFNQLGFPPIEPSFANIEPCDGAQVHGVVFDLTPEDFSVLWNGEGSGRWYATASITITCYDGSIINDAIAFTCLDERKVSKVRAFFNTIIVFETPFYIAGPRRRRIATICAVQSSAHIWSCSCGS